MSNVAKIKQQLLERKQELEQDLQRLSSERLSVDQQVQDPVDQATLSNMEDLNITLENKEREEYAMILRALEMIADGTYGICIDCGNAISEKRLMLYPNATRCIGCQETYENA